MDGLRNMRTRVVIMSALLVVTIGFVEPLRAQIPFQTCASSFVSAEMSLAASKCNGAGAQSSWDLTYDFSVTYNCSIGSLTNCYVCCAQRTGKLSDDGTHYIWNDPLFSNSTGSMCNTGNVFNGGFIQEGLTAGRRFRFQVYYYCPTATGTGCPDDITEYAIGDTVTTSVMPEC